MMLAFAVSTYIPAYSQSLPASWSASVKASFNKTDQLATYTYTFTNVSGAPNVNPPILGLRCDYFNSPLLRLKNLYGWWSPYSNTVIDRSKFDCEAMFGRRIPSKNSDPNWANITPFPTEEDGDPMSGTHSLLDVKSYKTTNGWRVIQTNPCGEGTCGSVLYYLEFLAAVTAIDGAHSPVATGQSFVFSVTLDDKDPNYLLTNYLIRGDVDSENNFQYRAYPITKADTTPPVITASLSAQPVKTGDNKDFVRVQLTASVKDNFDAGPEWSVSSVLRTDKPTVAGDVSRTADMVDNQWLLKVPVGETRKYVVNVRAEDATGNVSTQAVPIELTGKAIVVNPPPKPKSRTICLWGNSFCFTVPFDFWR
jgi:hypothetical protein